MFASFVEQENGYFNLISFCNFSWLQLKADYIDSFVDLVF